METVSELIPAEPLEKPSVAAPAPNEYPLPVGMETPWGIQRTVTVRELNGRDEEMLARKTTMGLMLESVLEIAVVRVGDQPVTKQLLQHMYVADRVAALVAVSRVTWGDIALIPFSCDKCGTTDSAELDLSTLKCVSLPSQELDLKLPYRVTATLPRGDFHSKGLRGELNTSALFKTALIDSCVSDIGGTPLIALGGASSLGMKKRREISEAISEVSVGYDLTEEEVPCPSCGESISGAVTLGSLFPL